MRQRAATWARRVTRQRHELDRFQRDVRVVDVLVRDARPHEDGCARVDRHYFRWKFGVRFSANAFGPSLESADPMTLPV